MCVRRAGVNGKNKRTEQAMRTHALGLGYMLHHHTQRSAIILHTCETRLIVSNHGVLGDLFENRNLEFTCNANCFDPVNSQGLGVLANRNNQHVVGDTGAFDNRRTHPDGEP